MSNRETALPARRGSAAEVAGAFFKLGLTSFGGPVAHLGYFRREFVERRKWIEEEDFARLMALCQFLPGPASSKLGFSLGLLRAGWPGAFAAFCGFTLPSAALLFAFAGLVPYMTHGVGRAAVHGLQLVAVAVVAQAVLGMARHLCPDPARAAIAVLAAMAVLASGHAWMQVVVVVAGAIAGLACCKGVQPPARSLARPPHGMVLGGILLAIFALLLIALPLVARSYGGMAAVADAFYRAGALVFGGGHVVLPLLREAVVVPGWISSDDFLAGYGAAQAIPGPMFSFAAYLGASLFGGQGGLPGAAVALVAIFLPGLLLVSGTLPYWSALSRHPSAARAVAGVNAAVVGLLAAAFYDPVWLTSIQGPWDIAIAAVAFVLLTAWRAPPLVAVLWCVIVPVVAAVA